jgi:DNA polymerase delta subunit 3
MIHVYSVQPSTLQDLNTLTNVCREMATAHAQEDPLECGSQWGMIQNRNVKVGGLEFPQSLRS